MTARKVTATCADIPPLPSPPHASKRDKGSEEGRRRRKNDTLVPEKKLFLFLLRERGHTAAVAVAAAPGGRRRRRRRQTELCKSKEGVRSGVNYHKPQTLRALPLLREEKSTRPPSIQRRRRSAFIVSPPLFLDRVAK